jgi:hypothetical protein
MVDNNEFRRLLAAVAQPVGRGFDDLDVGLAVGEVPERRQGLGGGYDLAVREDPGVQALLRRPLEYLDAQILRHSVVQQRLAVHSAHHRAAVADHRVLPPKSEPLGVLPSSLKMPSRRYHEPHPPLAQLAQRVHRGVRDGQVAAQHRAVEIKGAKVVRQATILHVVIRPRQQNLSQIV